MPRADIIHASVIEPGTWALLDRYTLRLTLKGGRSMDVRFVMLRSPAQQAHSSIHIHAPQRRTGASVILEYIYTHRRSRFLPPFPRV